MRDLLLAVFGFMFGTMGTQPAPAVTSGPTSNWILRDGAWRDAGVWEDTATWDDGA